jgi:hypothetical protein
MLVTEDKYETYRLGYKRGHDRGYEVAKQQDSGEIAGLNMTVERLQHELDDEIQRIAVSRHVNEEQKRREAEIAAGWL